MARFSKFKVLQTQNIIFQNQWNIFRVSPFSARSVAPCETKAKYLFELKKPRYMWQTAMDYYAPECENCERDCSQSYQNKQHIPQHKTTIQKYHSVINNGLSCVVLNSMAS